MDRNTAAEKFAQMLFDMGIQEGFNTLLGVMSHPTGTHKQQWITVKAWYDSISSEEKERIHFLLRQMSVFSVTGIAAFLDGVVGYVDTDGNPAEFSVALHTYRDYDAAEKNQPEEVIPICPTQFGEEVNDILLSIIDATDL